MNLLSQKSHESRYRSIKYRSASTQITTKSIVTAKIREQSLSITRNFKCKFTSRSTKQLALSLPNCLTSKKQKQMFATIKNSQYLKNNSQSINNQEEEDNFKKSKYMQSFQSLMALQSSNRKVDYSELGAAATKIVQIKSKFKGSRVCLPNIIENGCSNFTVLDPLRLPIQYIQSQIESFKGELSHSTKQLQAISIQLGSIKEKYYQSLQELKNQAKKHFSRFERVLKNNKVEQQQITLKVNRQLSELKQFAQSHKQAFDKMVNQQLKIQEDIFSNRPFQLQVEKDKAIQKLSGEIQHSSWNNSPAKQILSYF